MTVYRNESYLPHIYAAASPTLVFSDFGALESLSRGSGDFFIGPAFFLADQLSDSELDMVAHTWAAQLVVGDDPLEGPFSRLRGFVVTPGEATITGPDPKQEWTNLAYSWSHDWHYAAALDPAQGVYTTTEARMTLSISTDGEPRRAVYLRPHFGPEGSALSLDIDGRDVGSVVTKAPSDIGFRWAPMGDVELQPGPHRIELRSERGKNAVLGLALVPPGAMEEAVGRWREQTTGRLVNAARGSETAGSTATGLGQYPPALQSTKVNPTRYEVAVSGAEGPFVLVFSETFNPGWKAYVLDAEQNPGALRLSALLSRLLGPKGAPLPDHLRVNGYANAWYVDRRGDFSIILAYQPQITMEVGILMSGLTLLSVGYLLTVAMRRRRRYLRRVNVA